MESFKVLHVYKGYFPSTIGGIPECIHQLSYGTQQLGVNNSLLVLDDHVPSFKYETIKGLHIYRCPVNFSLASTPFSFRAIRIFQRLISNTDIIHYHYPYPFGDILDCLFGTEKKKIVTYHSDIIKQKFFNRIYQPLNNHFFDRVDKIVATSPNYFQTSKTLQKYRDKVETITIGLFDELFEQASVQTIEKWSALYQQPFFLFIGACRYYKGLATLIRACRLNNFPVIVVGNDEGKNYQKMAAKHQVQNMHFLGELPEQDKMALLNLCMAVILPSDQRSEALGISLIEGAMHSKPLISCDMGTGTSYINLNDVTGKLIKPGCAFELNEAMKFLYNNKDLALKMGHNAQARYRDLFTGEKMSAAYLSLYHSLLNEKNQPS